MKPTGPVLKILVPLLIILAGFAVYEYGYVGLRSQVSAVRDEEGVKLRTLRKYTDFVAKKAEFESTLATLKETRKADDSKLLQGQTPAVAAASLQSTVKSLVTSRGGTISSERVEKPVELAGFRIIGVSVDAIMPDIRALEEVLYAVETQTPYLVVSELDVRLKDMREPRELMTRLKIVGITSGK